MCTHTHTHTHTRTYARTHARTHTHITLTHAHVQVFSASEQEAAFLMSLPYTVSSIFCPICGYLVDRTG